MRDIKYILRDVIGEFYNHGINNPSLIKDIIEYIDTVSSVCPKCHTSNDVKLVGEYIMCYKCGVKIN